ncbi:MAG: metallopeptidase family protein [Eubacterium aggregans]|uniref:Zinicin-like metallopeptidase n=1 Tax=Eubacterium aggregans TaxID=81409 RepID=A0A1H4B875_9FIRM|nr:metallopeptidase family protein [Eubacterium aggregans]MDD4690618.1 metallopeptidase family protein [Eubacterium aggregans]MEA5073142.1 metallopeptidase family protein [Eubacterium aggregans]SEA44350.1 Zinicin-like metallopeptidase [Eubacterium aggregans]
MIGIDGFQGILEELAGELPRDFYRELNRLIILEEGAKRSPQSVPEAPLYIMGEYTVDALGRGITLYYGSFVQVYGGLAEKDLRDAMRRVLRHEFRHHLESLSGIRDLEILDRIQMEEYRASQATQSGGDHADLCTKK